MTAYYECIYYLKYLGSALTIFYWLFLISLTKLTVIYCDCDVLLVLHNIC